MNLETILTMIFALGSIYGGLAITLIYFFRKKNSGKNSNGPFNE